LKNPFNKLKESIKTDKFNISMHTLKLFLCLAVSFTLTYAITDTFGLQTPIEAILRVALVCMLVYSLVFFNNVTLNIALSSITVFSIAVTLVFNFTDRLDGVRVSVYQFFESFIKWLASYYMVGTPRDKEYENLVFYAICVFITLLAFIFIVKKYLIAVVLGGGFAIFCIQWAYGFSVNYNAFYFFVATMIFAYVFHVYNKSIKGADVSAISAPYKFSFYMLPLCLFIMLLVSTLPAPNSPIRWDWLYSKVEQASTFYRDNYIYYNIDSYGLNTTGFSSGESFLSGPVRLDYTHVLTVRTSNPELYLKGSGKSIYTGNSWQTIDAEEEQSAFLSDDSEIRWDYEEYKNSYLIYLFRRARAGIGDSVNQTLEPDEVASSLESMLNRRTDSVEVIFSRLRSRSIFIPTKFRRFSREPSGGGVMFEKNGALSLENRVSEGFSYNVEYLMEREYSSANIIAQTSYRGIYGDLLENYDTAKVAIYSFTRAENNTHHWDLHIRGLNDFIDRETLDLLKERSDRIKAKYLQLPDMLPERVRILANEITKDIDSDYEKLKTLERFLLSNYKYTLETGYLTPGKDFVDTFLFELKDGYCTHFATAMAVMARCIGLPSKYVEGYIMPEFAAADGAYLVTNAEAHAWVEVYLEGYGWKSFEPTGIFRVGDRGGGQEQESSLFGSDNSGESDLYSALFERVAGMYSESGNSNVSSVETESKRDYSLFGGFWPWGNSVFAFWCYTLLFVALAAGIFILVTRLTRRFRRERFRSTPDDAVQFIFRHSLQVLEYMGERMAPSETPIQFAERIKHKHGLENGCFLEASEIFSKACYSRHAMTDAERESVYLAYREIAGLFTKKANRFTKVILQNLLAAI